MFFFIYDQVSMKPQDSFSYAQSNFFKLNIMWGVCTLWRPDMAIFLVFLRYKKINKIKFIEIMKKRTHLFKVIIINLPRMKNQIKIVNN